MDTPKWIGLSLLLLIIIYVTIFPCGTNLQHFVLYGCIGVSFALLFPKSAEKTSLTITILKKAAKFGGAAAIPVTLILWDPISQYAGDACQTKRETITVFVHGKNGRQVLPLRNGGIVLMKTSSEPKRSSINENGEAFFYNLTPGEKVTLDIVFSEPYNPIRPDSVYVIQTNELIDLEVTLQNAGTISGHVRYNDDPLPGVQVQVDTITVLTDHLGTFNIKIPENKQKDNYSVLFYKQGFKSQTAPAYPQTGKPLEINLEKK